MDNHIDNDLLINAEIALNNGQYGVAMEWFRKAIRENPDDLYTLSRAGAVCVSQQLFDEALQYFSRALQLDPTNGDNHFNLGNAYFFRSDYTKAFSLYVEAERIGCTPETLVQMYYQMMLLSTIRQDLDCALIYLKKCEDADPSGTIALTPDFISEKLKIHMLRQEFKAAEKYAAQLVSIQPTVFRHYAVYFSLLMAAKDYRAADSVLKQASHYARMNEEEQITLVTHQAALYMALAEQDAAKRAACQEKAIAVLSSCQQKLSPQDDQYQNVVTTLCDVYYQAEQYDNAIGAARSLLDLYTARADGPVLSDREAARIEEPDPNDLVLDDMELEEIFNQQMTELDEKISIGEVNFDEIQYADVLYNEDGIPNIQVPDELLSQLDTGRKPIASDWEKTADVQIVLAKLTEASRDKLYFTLVSCLLAKDEYAEAQEMAKLLKHSENRYYRYYGIYALTTACRYTCSDAAEINRTYTKTLAFFRSRVAADRKDNLAVTMRARLYTEMGNFEMARQMADMLTSNEREAVHRYIDELTK